MPLIPLRVVLDHAAENNYGVAAFNVNNMEQIQSIMEAARETNSPVIVQASREVRAYSQDNYLRHLMLAASELYPEIPIVMHQDHGNRPATCCSAIKYGFTSVMMDGSLKEDGKTPVDYDYNVAVTAEIVNVAHKFGVSAEGELSDRSRLDTEEGGSDDGHGAMGLLSHDRLLTDPNEAERYAKAKIGTMAAAIDNSHGAFNFDQSADKVLVTKRIERHRKKQPNAQKSIYRKLSRKVRKLNSLLFKLYAEIAPTLEGYVRSQLTPELFSRFGEDVLGEAPLRILKVLSRPKYANLHNLEWNQKLIMVRPVIIDVVRKIISENIRKSCRFAHASGGLEMIVDHEHSDPDLAREILDQVKPLLTERELNVFVAKAEGRKTMEIAEELQMGANGVRSLIYRARDRIREWQSDNPDVEFGQEPFVWRVKTGNRNVRLNGNQVDHE